jgi:hypothetical protein
MRDRSNPASSIASVPSFAFPTIRTWRCRVAEYIREVVVTIEVDTNKSTHKQRLTWQDGEMHEEFARRVIETISELTEL